MAVKAVVFNAYGTLYDVQPAPAPSASVYVVRIERVTPAALPAELIGGAQK